MGNNPIVIWLIPGFACVWLWKRREFTISTAAAFVGTSALGLCVYAYLPLRSATNFAARRDPTLALGIPPGRPFWDYAHPALPHNFWWLVTGAQVHAASSLARFDGLGIGLLRTAELMWGRATPLLVFVGIIGAAFFVRGRVWWGVALLLFALASWPFTATFVQETEPVRYLLVPMWLCAAFAALLVERLAASGRATVVARGAAAAVCVCVLTVEFASGRHLFAQRNEHLGSTYVRNVVAATRDGSIVVSPWVPATPLGYAAYVERSFGTRVLDVSTVSDDAARIRVWLRERPVYAIGYVKPSAADLTFRFVRRMNLDPVPAEDAKLWQVTRKARARVAPTRTR